MDEGARSARAYSEQFREEAQQIRDSEIRKALPDIASNYERLANRISKRVNPI